LPPAQDRALRLERFLAPAQLDPLLYAGRSLYLLPDGPAAEPGYAVLKAALIARQRWALGQTRNARSPPGRASHEPSDVRRTRGRRVEAGIG
jgi:non-homologous end joining protein Ku